MSLVAGADGCPGGWIIVLRDPEHGTVRADFAPTFRQLLRRTSEAETVGVDIPIGLLDRAQPGGRECDRAARRLLGPGRSASVFSPPVRPALRATDYVQALAINRRSSEAAVGISRQTFLIAPRIREADDAMTPELQSRVREVHPEVTFAALNGGRPLSDSKKTPPGKAARLRLLEQAGFHGLTGLLTPLSVRRVRIDDLLDAAAVCWTAQRMKKGTEAVLPIRPQRDSRGLWMEIAY